MLNIKITIIMIITINHGSPISLDNHSINLFIMF